jgi:hypothetical protein
LKVQVHSLEALKMAATNATKQSRITSAEPGFWQKHSPRGECPISVACSVVLHVGVLALIVIIAMRLLWPGDPANDPNRPPEMQNVEIEGLGGGDGGNSKGIGSKDTGPPGKKEGIETVKTGNHPTEGGKPSDIKLKDIPKIDWIPGSPKPDDSIASDKGDPFAKLDQEKRWGEEMLAAAMADTGKTGGAQGPGMKGGDQAGPQGTAGGKKGPGIGNNPKGGAGRGDSKTGVIFTEQRRREFRWTILASDDGDTHLKKLQAMKVVLMIPLRKPGRALRFDLTKPSLVGTEVPAEDDSNKVRWKNDIAGEMVGLAKALHLKDVPPFAIIYLPSELERSMATKELSFQGRREEEILKTVWDVRQLDGVYENHPSIVKQILKPGVK